MARCRSLGSSGTEHSGRAQLHTAPADATSNAALDAVRDELVPKALGGVAGLQTWVDGQTAQERDFNDTR